ncbi:MAG: hypothetical protein HY026_02735 [Deltaproteobacteria bacterium]|nr:hypothetical protein [Deltaproteobacteria bacterium]
MNSIIYRFLPFASLPGSKEQYGRLILFFDLFKERLIPEEVEKKLTAEENSIELFLN